MWRSHFDKDERLEPGKVAALARESHDATDQRVAGELGIQFGKLANETRNEAGRV